MIPLDLQSEQYAATGNLASTGARNQLGRPKLDPITVLVRESVQNAWDARADRERGGVTVHFGLSTATREQSETLHNVVFLRRPWEGVDLRRVAPGQALQLLTITDRHTIGLGGPTRADVIVDDDAPRDFVDFLRNLGEAPDRSCSGGTYGYGKASLYAVSRAGCILVHTRARDEHGKTQRRFIGAGLGKPYVDNRIPVRRTGRHWWGRELGEVVEPLVGTDADTIAAALGMPSFTDGDGTTIMLVDFDTGGRSPRDAIDLIARALLWNFWPKMVPTSDGKRPMTFTASLDGVPVRIQPPEEHPTLRLYARGLRAARKRAEGGPATPGADTFLIKCHNPSRELGWLALVRDVKTGPAGTERDLEAGGLAADTSSHVALMRSAELVVRYQQGPPLQTDVMHYGAVFVTTDAPEVDDAFSKSEPPTHDDWVPQQLAEPSQRTLVKVGLKRIQERLLREIQPVSESPQTGPGSHLGGLSQLFGKILVGLPGTGGGLPAPEERTTRTKPIVEQDDEAPHTDHTDPPTSGQTGSDPSGNSGSGGNVSATPDATPRPPGKPRVRVSEPKLAEIDGLPVLMVDLDIRAGIRTKGTRLTVTACAVLDSGDGETSPPHGAQVPTVYSWIRPDGSSLPASGGTVDIDASLDGRWAVLVRLIDDAEVRVDVAAEPVVNH